MDNRRQYEKRTPLSMRIVHLIWPLKPLTWRPTPPMPYRHCLQYLIFLRNALLSAVQYLLIGVVLFILVIWLGARYQQRAVDRAPDTLYLYSSDQVCAVVLPDEPNTTPGDEGMSNLTKPINQTDNSSPGLRFPPHLGTFESEEAARAHGDVLVAHCEGCGACSNPHDVGIYYETRNTLTNTAIECAKRGLIWGRRTSGACMKKRVGFTPACHDCWVENIVCDLKFCAFVCTWNRFFARIHGSSDEGKRELNPCTRCDEKRCGPDFIQCAGANRRRSGIFSDIQREDDLEVCTVTDDFWWDDERLRDYRQSLQPRLP
eukprot:CAMPEP_0116836702 /NCGR_PEP_ID=MMETSP0418-20121206/8245_1 /TAXON_ID=1158023 /ORGANISM="Astrosyne radiata, Strain 13vi08-1A" /LENGTH=316 /DNA_ID=CAMNT_0004466505 /DNA_START=45 /DNA_END=995 /DNA_ORIENTATION=+